MKKDPLVFVEHILESIERVESFTSGITKDDFNLSELIQSAVVRQIEIIGEATKNIPMSFRDKYPSIPWKEIVGTRDKMIHHYFAIDLNLTWEIIKVHLPKLKKDILKIIEENKE